VHATVMRSNKQEQEQPQVVNAGGTSSEQTSSNGSDSCSNGNGNGNGKRFVVATVVDGAGSSLPELAVAAANASNASAALNAKVRSSPEKQSGVLARVKKLSLIAPITVPKRAINGGDFLSPSSGSPTPTPTDFSPMLLPRAEANLTALISEHNKQLQQAQQQQQQASKLSQLQTEIDSQPAVAKQPPAKRAKLSKRGRKRHSEIAAVAAGVDSGSAQPTALPMNGGMNGHVPQRRSSLGSTAVSLVSEEAATAVSLVRKGPWLPEEDAKLLELVAQFGAYDWSFIADHIPGRVGKQCRERYFNHLAPDVRKEAWTDHEDDAIVHAHHVVGNKWTNIAKMLGNGRSPNSIKNRWHSSLKNRLGEHGGEASVMEATGAAHGCQCDCKLCDCSCKVACVAFGCQCCFAAHHASSAGAAEFPPHVVSSTGTDDESVTAGSASSSVTTTPASATSSAVPPPAAVPFPSS